MFKYRYTLQSKTDKHFRATFEGCAINFQQMLAKIEREKNLDDFRIIELKEMKR